MARHRTKSIEEQMKIRTKPYISFVIAARNDNYGGNFLHRITIFFTSLLFFIKKYHLDGEIIVVEWNPPSDKAQLAKKLHALFTHSTIPVRFINVPNSIHKTLPNADKMPIFEYIAKNVGIRRAQGKYILVTNPDIIFPEIFIKYLSTKPLNPISFYRTDRIDVKKIIPMQLKPTQQILFAKNYSYNLNAFGSTIPLFQGVPFVLRLYISYFYSLVYRLYRKKTNRIEDRVHVNAAGDFLLMTKENWLMLHGFPELPTHSFIDGYLCCLAISYGLKQICLPPSMAIFHSDHDRPTAKRPKTSYETWKRECNRILKSPPKPINKSTWGLKKYKLHETTFYKTFY